MSNNEKPECPVWEKKCDGDKCEYCIGEDCLALRLIWVVKEIMKVQAAVVGLEMAPTAQIFTMSVSNMLKIMDNDELQRRLKGGIILPKGVKDV